MKVTITKLRALTLPALAILSVRGLRVGASAASHSAATDRAPHGSVSEAGREDAAKRFACGGGAKIGNAAGECSALNQERRRSRSG